MVVFLSGPSSATARGVASAPHFDLVGGAGIAADSSPATTDPSDPPRGVLSRGAGYTTVGAATILGGLVALGLTLTLLVRRRHAAAPGDTGS